MDEINVEGIEEYRESEVRIVGNKVELTREDYDKLNEDLEIAQLQLQEANDTLNGGITNRNMAHLRNTYCINSSDSLDDTHPMLVYFRVLDETINIVSVKVSYWIHKYRAYSKASAAGGGQTSSGSSQETSSGSSNVTSSSVTTPSGGQTTSDGIPTIYFMNGYFVGVEFRALAPGHQDITHAILDKQSTLDIGAHTHNVPNHTHPAHTHTLVHTHTLAHTHTVANHEHAAAYGIYEEDTTPIIKFSVCV